MPGGAGRRPTTFSWQGESAGRNHMKIGVLALQGDFAEHLVMLRRLGVEATEVRLPDQLDGLDGLIIPGGESTTIGKLAVDYALMDPLHRFGLERAIWGTCAGAIFLSKDARRHQPLLGLMDITVERNAFGRQVASRRPWRAATMRPSGRQARVCTPGPTRSISGARIKKAL